MEMKQQLIIIADDYGYSNERDDGILQCYKAGAITGVSLMVNGHSAERAVQNALCAGLPIDLHLNLSEGRPISNSTESLTDKDGFMFGKMGFREAVSNGSVSLAEIKMEIQAQIDRFQSLTGFKPIKVDGHQHVHILPGVCEVFAQTLAANQIHFTRLPIEDRIDLRQWSSFEQAEFVSQLIMQSCEAGKVFTEYGIRYPRFIGLKTMGKDMSLQHLQFCIRNSFKSQMSQSLSTNTTTMLKILFQDQMISKELLVETFETESDGIICELMVHPGNVTGSVGGCGNGPDKFSQSHDREHEMKILMSSDMLSFYHENDINFTSFSSLV